ncbi:hypothetical protein AN218_12520 [Streptomyces nanshensis]|uniref:Uncharacterized protein n=1 Tax=Streptomyces nanshensis TaxID=518642 RepID=A0A1E7L5X9_9ACTN|nr:hypothetical protein AN218_12520 [Streptomyces nanshensis]
MITEMVAAAAHLERAVKRTEGPHVEVRTNGGAPDVALHGADVLAAAQRMRKSLDQLIAPYAEESADRSASAS